MNISKSLLRSFKHSPYENRFFWLLLFFYFLPFHILEMLLLKTINKPKPSYLSLIPPVYYRKGGSISYSSWIFKISLFQTIMRQYLKNNGKEKILDIGCGTGLIAISSFPFVQSGTKYIGIDVSPFSINFCKKNFGFKNYSFIHLNAKNDFYSFYQNQEKTPWPIESESVDLITALSVWTHLKSDEAIFYFREIYRVLKLGKRAIITFWLLKDKKELRGVGEKNGWFTPVWTKVPEYSIWIDENGLQILEDIGFKIEKTYYSDKPISGVMGQNIITFRKE